MRLLFIYCYKTKGTFKEGTIISLSKKYRVTHIDDFNFTLTKDDSFQDDFYGSNIDIGTIIGKNGTGKSILINSLRDEDNNYSLAVYEKKKNEFSYEGKVDNVIINKDKIELLTDVSSIYYSPIIDLFDFQQKNSVDISDKNILMKSKSQSLNESLSLLENKDILNYFNMSNRIDNIYFPRVDSVKIYYSKKFFEIYLKYIKSHNMLFGYMLEISKDDIELEERLTSIIANSLSYEEKIKFIDKIFTEVINKNFWIQSKFIKKMEDKLHLHDFSMTIEQSDALDSIFDRDLTYTSKQFIEESLYYFDENDDELVKIKYSILEYFLNRKIQDNIKKDVEKFSFLLEYIESISIYDFDFDEEQLNGLLLYMNPDDLIEKFVNLIYRQAGMIRFNMTILFLEDINIFTPYLLKLEVVKKDKYLLKSLFFCLFYDYMSDNNTWNIKLFVSLLSIDFEENKFYKFKVPYEKSNNVLDLLERMEKELSLNEKSFYDKAKILFSVNKASEIKISEDNYQLYIELLEEKKDFFSFELSPPLSSGQKAILFIFARIDNAIEEIKNNNITILLDEADLKLHLEWQRQFINDLVEFLKKYEDKKFYILYATHSPMILSDITDDRIVFLKKEGDYSIDKSIKEKKSTFGANIYDLYHDSFFMDKYMGEFAFNKINDVINMINLYKVVFELDNNKEKLDDYERIYDFDKLFKSYDSYYSEAKINIQTVYEKREEIKSNIIYKKEQLKSIAKFIGEPLLRNKIEDDLNAMSSEFDIDSIVEKLQDLSQEEIKDELSQYSESIQVKIVKKLFVSGT